MAAPANDNFADATLLVGASGTDSSTIDDATVEVDEPGGSNPGNDAVQTVWWKWVATENSVVTVDTSQSDDNGSGPESMDTVLAVWQGASVDALTEVRSSDDEGVAATSIVSFVALEGQTYHVQAGPYSEGTVGVLALAWSSVPYGDALSSALYGALGASLPTSDLYTIDAATGAATLVGPIGYAVTGIAFDPTTRLLYGVTSASSDSDPDSIILIDPASGAGILVGALNFSSNCSDICFGDDGQMYGWDAATGDLSTISKATGQATRVGFSTHPGGGLDFAGAVLYHLQREGDDGNLATIDPATGARALAPAIDGIPGTITAAAVRRVG